jgi:redox-sensitive bicupin YhaK (pirin superfamily)
LQPPITQASHAGREAYALQRVGAPLTSERADLAGFRAEPSQNHFRKRVPNDYLAGFPWHPHRGIETITYVLAGTVEHGDSLGNREDFPDVD